MKYSKRIEVDSRDYEVDGDGEISIFYTDYSGWSGPTEAEIGCSIEELEEVLKIAKAHRADYQKYVENGYED